MARLEWVCPICTGDNVLEIIGIIEGDTYKKECSHCSESCEIKACYGFYSDVSTKSNKNDNS